MKTFIYSLMFLNFFSCQSTHTKSFSEHLKNYGKNHKKEVVINSQKHIEGNVDFSDMKDQDYISFIKEYYLMHDHAIEETDTKIIVNDISKLKKQWFTDLKKAAIISQKNHKKILVKYEADWCTPCKMQTAKFLQSESSPLYDQYVLVKIDVVKNENTIKEMNLTNISLPRIDIFPVGKVKDPIVSLTGYNSNETIQKQIENAGKLKSKKIDKIMK